VVDQSQEVSTGSATVTVRRVLLALVALCVVAVVAYAATRPAPSSGSVRSVPAFRLPQLGGGFLGPSDLKGHPVVINFFASWCKPCRLEVGRLQDAYEQNRPNGVRFVGIATGDVNAHTRAFVSEHKVTYPVALDPHGSLAGKMHVFGLPETFFVTGDGSFTDAVRGHKIGTREGTVVLGPLSETRLEEGLKGLTSGKGAG
jgi:peroxiredoxin